MGGLVMGGADGAQLCTFDLVNLSGLLRVCEVELVLLDGNGPRAAVHSVVHDEALFCTIKTGFTGRGRFMLPLDWCLIGCIHRTNEATSWCHGAPLSNGSLMTLTPEGISEFVLSADSAVTLVMVPFKRLRQKFSELHLGDIAAPGLATAHLHLPTDHPLCGYYNELETRIAGGYSAMQGLSLDEVLEHHVRCIVDAGHYDRAVSGRGRRTHYMILRRAEEFMRMNLRHNIYMNEICDAAGVSERALRYAFDDLLGISPNRYLSMLRLCAACRGLSSADAGRKSVKAIALSCGLWDLSRFAENYRRVFGELPRDTLMRRSGVQETA
ncbi:AraC family transcriptional regulator [Stenotrophomonas panacihumi]|uniref:AraC family transcriptional regulator n=1 Tax=Stenotrophomonas panacihumi TaxID=676599 RepID=UPI000ADEC7D5|nr:AraC family transcriptional regulator [Stenotrophomonas panacihumi]